MDAPFYSTETYQIQTSKIKPIAELRILDIAYVEFIWAHTVLNDAHTAVQIDVKYEVFNKEKQSVCELVSRAIFNIHNITENEETKKLLEQLFYKSYGFFLECYDKHYKNSPVSKKDPYFPKNVDGEISDLLSSFFE